jgi:carboxymethylenebutenolidase
MHPAVVVWPDAAGLRPAMRDIGRRLAGEGYAVLVPNPFYRVGEGADVRDAPPTSTSPTRRRAPRSDR